MERANADTARYLKLIDDAALSLGAKVARQVQSLGISWKIKDPDKTVAG
ncbi:MAG: hypothetical protein AAF827_12325 [Cyanobacteria bacterium P01_D01_bin.6]